MLKIFFKLIIAFALISFIFSEHKDIPLERLFDLDRTDGSENFVVSLNNEFSFKIEGNPTTGYAWYLAEGLQDEDTLSSINLTEDGATKDYVDYPQSEVEAGMGGIFYFDFIGKRTGTYPLIFVYRRPFETEIKKEKIIKVTITDK
jgi:predicted secreted protein